MDPTQIEINKTKHNIVNLSNKLINTFNPSEEISINYELKKEVDFLLTLLTKKMNSPMNQMPMNNNNMNLINQMYNNNNINLVQQQQMQMIPNQLMFQQQPKEKVFITLLFRKRNEKPLFIKCYMDEKVRDVIQKYRNKSMIPDNHEKFIYNAKALYPDLTVEESGLRDNSTIFVVETKGIRGGLNK